MWTLGRKLALGFSLCVVLLLGVGVTGYRAVGGLTETSLSVAHTHEVLEHIARVQSLLKDAETGQRGFVITGDEAFLEPYQAASESLAPTIQALRKLTADNPEQQARIAEAEPLVAAKLGELLETIELRRTSGFETTRDVVAAGEGKRVMDDIRRVLGHMEAEERELLVRRADEVAATTSSTRTTIVVTTLLCLLLVATAGISITRGASIQVGGSVRDMQSSSAELQAAADQQVIGARSQVAAMNQISTTMSELLASSHQIAGSAQHVSRVAADTASSAIAGDRTVEGANASIAAIRRQVDDVVGHMRELGQKSQQIGSVLAIVAELAEQTQLLAINATLEAAGAGDAGRRFAVVADEIRKLADRVSGSTKEIRALIDDVRTAVSTTVSATDVGSKAVDAGSHQFAEVAAAFAKIAGMVASTTAAAREIELSTQQQATAVEQVKLEMLNVTQAARETEVGSAQTLQTAKQLSGVSRALMRMIEAE